MSNPVTLEEHREFRHKLLGIQLYFTAVWAEKHPEEPLHQIIEDRTQIYKYTDENPQGKDLTAVFYERPGWQKLMRAADNAWKKFAGSPAEFEKALTGPFGESVDRRIERDYEEMIQAPTGFQCGCFRHDDTLWRDTGWLCFHIGNPVRPHSIFESPNYMKHCLLCLADHTELMFGTQFIATNTWLNSYPKFLKYFPAEWMTNMRPPTGDVYGHLGSWGQFVNGRGLFNDRMGERFRATGELPFAQRESFCTINALRKHLENI